MQKTLDKDYQSYTMDSTVRDFPEATTRRLMMYAQASQAGNNFWADAPIINAYTREQAIKDGYLVDLMHGELAQVARQHYKYPVSCTRAVWEIMDRAVKNKRWCNDYAGILHDMLWMSRSHRRQISDSTVMFRVIITGAGRSKYHDFKLTVGPGDAGEPVVTLMMPEED